MRRNLIIAVLLATAAPLAAQPDYRGELRVFRHQITLQGFRFENFFQARGGAPEEDVNAAGFEYTTAYRRHENGPDFFGSLYVINYGVEGTVNTFGGRVGMSRYGNVHGFYAYLDRMQNGWSFDIGETTANANITSIVGIYSYRVHQDWQLGLSSYSEWQSFDVERTGYEGTYHELEGEVRYRGFGRIFEPRLGYAFAERDVEDPSDRYDHRYWFVELRSRPHPRVDVSVRFRDRTRDYQTVDRVEERDQWQLRGIFRQTNRIAWMARLTHEDVDSSRPNADFDTTRLYAGFIVDF